MKIKLQTQYIVNERIIGGKTILVYHFFLLICHVFNHASLQYSQETSIHLEIKKKSRNLDIDRRRCI